MIAARRLKILFSVNASWNVINFRAGLISHLIGQGYEVVVAAPRDGYSEAIEALGCRFVDMPMDPHGRSPIADLALLRRYRRLIRREAPDFYLAYTPKPNIYGSLAAQSFGVPTINNVAGLGLMFNERGPAALALKLLWRVALRRSSRAFFQNEDDRALFVTRRMVKPAIADLLPGSGIDLSRFACQPMPTRRPGAATFLLVARLLREKGLAELAAASARVRETMPGVEVRIVGFLEAGNPAYVRADELAEWQAQGAITYLGATDDVRPFVAAADCVILPTYYPEGTPRALLEAAASGRPVITTDMPGCRDVVEDGASGYLVAPRDVASLADAMRRFATLDDDERRRMGSRARARAERCFDERIVLDRYAAVLRRLGGVASEAG